MASPSDIYRRLFAGKKITVECDADGFERLRIALCKQHKTPRYLDLTTDSLCAQYDEATGSGTYWIGERRKKAKPMDFAIRLEEDSSAPECTDSRDGVDDEKV